MTAWHLDAGLVTEYIDGSTNRVQSASVEAHLLGCAQCRSMLASGVDTSRLDGIWSEVVDRVDDSRRRPVEWLLGRLGISTETARLLTATPSLSAAWLVAVAAVLGMAVTVATAEHGERWTLVFLGLAPLAPVVGVALSFGRRGDPSHELTLSAPYSAFRLLMVRAAAVLLTTTALAGIAALVLPHTTGTSAAWLLPALALTGLTLVLSSWFEPVHSAAGVTVVWLVTVLIARTKVDPLQLFDASSQIVFAVIAAGCAVVVMVRRDSFATRGGTA